MNRRTVYHIEFLGLPAAGKTTLARRLLHSDLAAGRNIFMPWKGYPITFGEKLEKLQRDINSAGKYLLGRPAKSFDIWCTCARFRQPSYVRQIRTFLNCLRAESLAKKLLISGISGDLILFDQGVFQAVWSLALESPMGSRGAQIEEFAEDLLDMLTLPDMVVRLDTPIDVIPDRLVSEPDEHRRFGRLIVTDPAWLDRGAKLIETLWHIACNRRNVATLRLTPDDDPVAALVGAMAGEDRGGGILSGRKVRP